MGDTIMRFSISTLLSQPGGRSERTIFGEAVEQVQLAESLGFHSAWFTEQHFNDFGISPDPLAFAAHLAGVTKTIRLGTGVVVLSIHNPIVIAERAALVDQLSSGRLDFGIGKGHPRQKFEAFNIRPDENEKRFYESHDIIKEAWMEPEINFEGEFFKAKKIRLVPHPIQSPHPPLWIATFGNPDVISFAAQNEYPLLHSSSGDGLKKNLDRYSREFIGSNIPVHGLNRMIYVCDSKTQAWEELQAPARWYVENNPGRADIIPSYDLAVSELIHKLGIIGSPEEVVEQICSLRDEHNVNSLICVFGLGGMSHEKVMASMRLFAEKVMPEFAE